MLKTATVTLLLVTGCLFYASAYPDNIANQPYAVQYKWIDSILNNSIRTADSANANAQLAQLQQWANDAKDPQLAYGIKVMAFYYSYDLNKSKNSSLETGLPVLIKELHENNMPELEAEALYVLSEYYWQNPKKYPQAFDAAFASYNIYQHFSVSNFPQKYVYIYDLGLAYYRFRDYQTANKIFLDIYRHNKEDKPEPVSILNTIGLCYRKTMNYDSAEYYFKKGYELATANNQKGWVGIIGGNLGITYYLRKQYREAIPLLENDISVSLEHNKLSDNGTNSMAILGDTYLELGDKKKGLTLLQQAYDMVRAGNKWNNYDLLVAIYQRLAKAYALNDNLQLAYNFADSARVAMDSSISQKNSLILAGAQQRLDAERHLAEKQQHDREAKVHREINAFLLISISLLVITIFFILRNYNNQKKTNVLLSREKKRSEDLLLNILPEEVADELKDKGSAETRYYDHVTVMFTDFVNFTKASELMNPQQLIEELHTCFKEFDAIIGRHNIEKIKTIGDAYLAVAGLPVPDEQHAIHITGAAIEIKEFMQKRQELMGDKTFQVRIGIHSGSVVAGIVGVIKFAYDIWGDTVNIAARMEQSSEAGKINISETTYDLVKNKFVCTPRGQISAKNKGELNMYFVEKAVAARDIKYTSIS